uniref:Uncharacterized protein n=1 Tax=Anguilla anguilla TaxID=7936 RepID=A0A0E9X550_ANGAN
MYSLEGPEVTVGKNFQTFIYNIHLATEKVLGHFDRNRKSDRKMTANLPELHRWP